MAKKIKVQDEQATFTQVANTAIKDPRLSRQAKLVYVVLCMHRNNETGKCFPSLQRIALLSGCGKSSVVKAVTKLERLGYIECARSVDENNPDINFVNVYTIKVQTSKQEQEVNKLLESRKQRQRVVSDRTTPSPGQDHPSPVRDYRSPPQDRNYTNLTILREQDEMNQTKSRRSTAASAVPRTLSSFLSKKPFQMTKEETGTLISLYDEEKIRAAAT